MSDMSDTPDILQKILARKAEEIAERQQRLSLRELRRRRRICLLPARSRTS
jgi:hypothetical protein